MSLDNPSTKDLLRELRVEGGRGNARLDKRDPGETFGWGKEQAVALTELVHGFFEDWIEEYPEQWICLKRRWPKAHKL